MKILLRIQLCNYIKCSESMFCCSCSIYKIYFQNESEYFKFLNIRHDATASNFSLAFHSWVSKWQFYMFNLWITLMIEELHWLWKDSKENREKQERKRFSDKAGSVSHLHFSCQYKPVGLSQMIPSVDKRSPWTISIVFRSCLLMSL